MDASTPIVLTQEAPALTLLDLLMKGGWVMWPLLLLSILAVYALIERMWIFYGQVPARSWQERLHATGLESTTEDFQDMAHALHPASRMLAIGIARAPKGAEAAEAAMQGYALEVMHRMEKRLGLLSSIAGLAPMLGFLGTVLGMITCFMGIADSPNQVSPKLLSSGTYEAMITTAAGLVVGIFAQVSYNYLTGRLAALSSLLEQTANRFMDSLRNR